MNQIIKWIKIGKICLISYHAYMLIMILDFATDPLHSIVWPTAGTQTLKSISTNSQAVSYMSILFNLGAKFVVIYTFLLG